MVLGLQGSSCRKTASVFVHQHTQGSVDGIFDWNCGCWWRVGERPVGCPRNKRGVMLTHWGRMMHICFSKLTTIGSDNSLSPGRRQAIIWTNDGILLIRTLGTNFSEIISKIHPFSFKKMHLKMSSAKWRLSRLGLNELREVMDLFHMRTL